MPVNVQWDDDTKQAIVLTFDDRWTWHECKEALQTAVYLRESVDYNISIIYDITPNKLPPRTTVENIQKLTNLTLYPVPEHIIIVEKGHRIEMMMDSFNMLFANAQRYNIAFASSLPRARALVTGV